MWEEVLSLAMSNGIWAVLFCSLLIFQLKDSKKREQKYIQTLDSLTESLKCVFDIEGSVSEIKQALTIAPREKNKKVG